MAVSSSRPYVGIVPLLTDWSSSPRLCNEGDDKVIDGGVIGGQGALATFGDRPGIFASKRRACRVLSPRGPAFPCSRVCNGFPFSRIPAKIVWLI